MLDAWPADPATRRFALVARRSNSEIRRSTRSSFDDISSSSVSLDTSSGASAITLPEVYQREQSGQRSGGLSDSSIAFRFGKTLTIADRLKAAHLELVLIVHASRAGQGSKIAAAPILHVHRPPLFLEPRLAVEAAARSSRAVGWRNVANGVIVGVAENLPFVVVTVANAIAASTS